MELAKVLREIENEGKYWRGDSKVWIKNGEIVCEYIPKEGHSPSELLRDKKVKGGLKLENNDILRVEAPKEAIEDVIDLVNSIEYPDEHIVKRAGCRVRICQGEVAEIGEPRILYCPLAKEGYGRKVCTEFCHVKPFIEREFASKIEEGMFTERRKITKSKARYTYGASEMLMDALRERVIDAAIVVCDGAGTVIVEDAEIVQGIGEKMTGVFYTTPHKGLIKRLEENSFVLHPETARIDQLKGVHAALKKGYEKIAVTTADEDSKNLKKIKRIDEDIVTLALCTTGIVEETAKTIIEYADLTWACGSKHVREVVGPKAWMQLGTRFPVFVLTTRGFELAKPRIRREFGHFIRNHDLSLKPDKKYHNFKEVNILPKRSRDEPYPLN